MATSDRTGSESLRGRLPLHAGATYGGLAWLVGFASVAAALNFLEAENPFPEEWFSRSGWVFYNAHYVDVVREGVSVNVLHDEAAQALDWTIPAAGYTLFVLVLLGAAGYYVAAETWPPSGSIGAVNGATVAVGYFPLTVLGSFVFEIDGGSPELGTAAIVMGITLPVVVGAIGGFLAGAT